jgi:hypothetical protein
VAVVYMQIYCREGHCTPGRGIWGVCWGMGVDITNPIPPYMKRMERHTKEVSQFRLTTGLVRPR